MKISHLATHTYAPELNRLYWENGASIRVPGITSLKAYRATVRPRQTFIQATVTTHYTDDLKWLERTHQGPVASRANALAWARMVVAPTLAPGGTFKVKTRLMY